MKSKAPVLRPWRLIPHWAATTSGLLLLQFSSECKRSITRSENPRWRVSVLVGSSDLECATILKNNPQIWGLQIFFLNNLINYVNCCLFILCPSPPNFSITCHKAGPRYIISQTKTHHIENNICHTLRDSHPFFNAQLNDASFLNQKCNLTGSSQSY